MGKVEKMTDELYLMYKEDPDFQEYIDKWCRTSDLSIFEAFRLKMVQEYAQWLKEQKRGKYNV
jgi:hypothetical protein